MSIEKLRQNAWLAGLSDNARDILLRAAKMRHYAASQRVLTKHAGPEGLYGVVSGEVRMSAATVNGGEVVFTRLRPGDWFGEIALLDGGDRTHDGHAAVDTNIAILPKQTVLQLCDQYPEVYKALVALLCLHCRQAFSAIDEFLLYTPTQQMARRVLHLVDIHAQNVLPLSQSELGAMVGISRQSANKILKNWEASGIIQRQYGGIKILNISKLEAMFVDKL